MIRNSVILATLVSTFTFAQQGPDRRNNSNMVQDAGGQVFNVRAYGAKIDGTTDDSPAVQSAIKAASSVGGGEVLIPSGIVALDSRVNMAANVSVHCSARGTILLFRQPTDGIVWPRTASHSGAQGCTLRAGNASSGKAIDIEDPASAAQNVVVEDVRIDAAHPPAT